MLIPLLIDQYLSSGANDNVAKDVGCRIENGGDNFLQKETSAKMPKENVYMVYADACYAKTTASIE